MKKDWYYCPICFKMVERELTGKYYESFCGGSGFEVRLRRLDLLTGKHLIEILKVKGLIK